VTHCIFRELLFHEVFSRTYFSDFSDFLLRVNDEFFGVSTVVSLECSAFCVWLRPLSQERCARAVAFSPDGRHLAVGLNSGCVSVYDASTLQLLVTRDLNAYGKPNNRLAENWIEVRFLVVVADQSTITISYCDSRSFSATNKPKL
jgi:WD40 repeat protein